MDTAQQIQDFVKLFTAIVWEALPFIVLGSLIAGILEELLPQEAIGKILPKHVVPAVVIGGLLGLIFPMCECGIVVVMRRLLKKGLPLSCCVAYMLAGPIVNIVVIMSTWVAFAPHKVGADQASLGVPMILLRCGMGFLVACITGIIVHIVQQRSKESLTLIEPPKSPPKPSPSPSLSLGMVSDGGPAPANGDSAEPASERRSLWQRMNKITSTALHDFLDIMCFLIIGSLLAATVKSNPNWIKAVEDFNTSNPLLAIPAMMLLAVLLCLCSEADAFLAASYKEMAISAKLSFLVLGPMLDIKLLLMYTRVFKRKLILVIVACTVLQVGVYSTLVHFVYNPTALQASPRAGTVTPG